MPPKSRRNRRNISSNPPAAAINQSTFENKRISTAAVKPASVESFITDANFVRDLKWTGIVAVIITVLIVVALFVIPH